MSDTNETIDNTTAIRHLIEGGDLDAVKTILGDSCRIKHSGVIRPGIKVCLSSCTDKEKAIYAKMYAEGHSFDEIDQALGGNKPIEGQQGKFTKSKLRPANCDYFTIRREDFKNPADADMINEKFADPDGRVRRIRIWFPIGDLHLIAPHGYRGFSGDGSVKCYSEFDGSGKLICHYIPTDEQMAAKKERRRPKYTTRPCDHESCAAYEKKHCDFGGMIRFNIPGMRGMGEVIIPTTSIYGLRDAIANLKRVRDVFGRFFGLFQGEPFFELIKQQEEVKAPDGSRQKQFVPTIEPCVDLMELARHAEVKATRGAAAINMFNGGDTARSFFNPPLGVPYPPQPDLAAHEHTGPVVQDGVTREPATAASASESADEQQPEVSERRAKCLTYLENAAKAMSLPAAKLYEFAATQNFGATINGLTDDEIVKFCEQVGTSIKKDPASFKADILAVVGG